MTDEIVADEVTQAWADFCLHRFRTTGSLPSMGHPSRKEWDEFTRWAASERGVVVPPTYRREQYGPDHTVVGILSHVLVVLGYAMVIASTVAEPRWWKVVLLVVMGLVTFLNLTFGFWMRRIARAEVERRLDSIYKD